MTSLMQQYGAGHQVDPTRQDQPTPFLHKGAIQFRDHYLIWKTWAPLQVKIFLWLAFRRRHWTGDRRARHGSETRERCYLGDHAQETIDHIVVSCPYTREVWSLIYQAFGRVLLSATQSIIKWWRRVHADWNGSRRSGIDSLFALISWEVWKQRNARCFTDAVVTPADLLLIIRAEAERWAQVQLGSNERWIAIRPRSVAVCF